MRLHNRTRRSGATLVEILVVIAIITTLSGLSFLSFTAAKRFTDRIESETAKAIASVKRSEAQRPGAAQDTAAPLKPGRPRQAKITGEYYVGFSASAGAPAAEAQRLARLVGGKILHVYSTTIPGCALQMDDAKVPVLRTDLAVSVVEQASYVYPAAMPACIKRVFSNGIKGDLIRWNQTVNGQMYGVPPSIYRLTATTPRPIVTSRVFIPGSTTANVTIAIMDTGIDSGHPDLFVVSAVDFTGGNNPHDTDGHGTHVAGIVGGADRAPAPPDGNGGVRGVYPGAPLLNLKVMNAPAGGSLPNIDGLGATGSSTTVLAALDYVYANAGAIRICLMPFEMAKTDSVDQRVDTAANAGVLMIAAAGNGAPGKSLDTTPVSPANASQAIVVGAIADGDGFPSVPPGSTDARAAYSNFGRRVDFAAPGDVNFSTIPPIANPTPPPFILYNSTVIANQGGRTASGTSFAAAHVAGMMALMLDPHTEIGFIIGNRAMPTYRFQMTNRAGAINALRNLTHQTTTVQIINPGTGSMWQQFPVAAGFSLKRVAPFTINLYDDVVNFNGGVGPAVMVPVANFYVNPNDPIYSVLPPFRGDNR